MSENPFFSLFRNTEHQRYSQFVTLREQVHLQMRQQLHERQRTHPQRSREEQELGLYIEQLEPQVRDAVLEFNRKGYKTGYSGFSGGKKGGRYNIQYQEISGGFFIDHEVKESLAARGVEVTTEPSWTWEMEKRLRKADPNTPPERRIATTVRFKADRPDLLQIENKWKEIATLLPNKTA
jgi:hypothetical protein